MLKWPSRLMLAAGLLTAVSSGCGQGSKACRGEYSAKGDSEAVRELVGEFTKTIALAQGNHDIVLLSEASRLARARDLRGMEEWICRTQQKYGPGSTATQ